MIEIIGYDLIGYIGMILVLITMALTRKHYRKSQVVSILGSGTLVAYSLLRWEPPYMLLNLILVLISTWNLVKASGKKHGREG